MTFIPNAGKMVMADGVSFSLDDIGGKRNNNCIVVGASGTSKTRSFVIPNILEATGSYVISDPKGSLYKDYHKHLKDRGYKVYLLDFRNIEKSNRYNPLDYVKKDDDAIALASILYTRTKSTDKDKYWELSAINLLAALISHIKTSLPYKYRNLGALADMLNTRKLKIGLDNTLVDFLNVKYKPIKGTIKMDQLLGAINREGFDEEDMDEFFKFLNEKHPCTATRYYSQLFKDGDSADTTKECIFMEANFAMEQYATDSMRKLTSESDFDFRDLGNEKTAIFVTCSDTDRSKDQFVSLFYSQCLQVLCNYADTECKDNRLPVPVRFFLDDFATNYKIADFDKIITMIRSRGISASIIIQDVHQLESAYNEAWHTIISNCDNAMYLGGNDYETSVEISKQFDVPLDDIRSMKYRDCYIYRRLEETKKSKTINLDMFKRALMNGTEYKCKMPEESKKKVSIGFRV